MAASAAAPPLAAHRRIPFDRLSGYARLFRQYATGDPAALAFFPHDWRQEASARLAARRALAVERDREGLVEVLLEQNRAWGNLSGMVAERIQALRDADSVAVVTGQQLGLFCGPMFTLYKAITTLQLARHYEALLGRPVVPIFWLADEDHDFDEVRSAVVVSRDQPASVALPPEAGRLPVGRRRVGPEIEGVLSGLAEHLPRAAYRAWLDDLLRRTYRPGTTHREAFARALAALFGDAGLVLISADDRRLKRSAASILRRELEDPAASLGALLAARRALAESGFQQQVTPLPINLFLLDDSGRLALDPAGPDAFAIRGTARQLRRDEALRMAAAEPERFSPNVVLRPIVQDTLLPTIAYVGGPAEIAYFAQLRGVYDCFGVPMPVVYPRASATLVEPRVRRVLEALRIQIEDFEDGSEAVLEGLHRRLAMRRDEHEVEQRFNRARALLDDAVAAVAPAAEATEPTLARSVGSTRERLLQALAALETKVVRAQKRRHQNIRAQLDRAASHLVPGGAPQERVLSPIHFLNRYGPGLIPHLLESLSLDTAEHQSLDV